MNKEFIIKTVKGFAKDIGEAVIPVIGAILVNKAVSMVQDVMTSNVKYNDVVKAIMDNSAIWSSDKNRFISAVKKDADADYYKAVIRIVESSMWSEDKFKAIENLSE